MPHARQYLSVALSSSAKQFGQVLGSKSGRWRRSAISLVTIPVGTAKVPQPMSIMVDAINLPKSVFGVMSPKPTVVMVVIAQ